MYLSNPQQNCPSRSEKNRRRKESGNLQNQLMYVIFGRLESPRGAKCLSLWLKRMSLD